MRDICGILGVNRSSSIINRERIRPEEVLRAEIEELAGAYPRYGYRRITQLLVRQGYTVGTRRVARLMKDNNLLVSVKRACQTTKRFRGLGPWSNLLENLEVSHQDQVWVADITYVRLKGRFIYVCLLMDVFTRHHQSVADQSALEPISDAQTATTALCHSVPEIHHSDQGVQYLSKAYITTLQEHGVEIPSPNADALGRMDMAERLIRNLKEEEVNINDYQSITEAEIASDILSHMLYHQKTPTTRR